ncbi:MAG: serine/threonine-protein kinase [Elusimicrobia bacterium]|nr:serine/threonine-protein kinase [Elusimicrobiota bacterium]
MLRALRILPLLLVCLASPASAQGRPPVERTDSAAQELAADVKRSPTTRGNVRERLERLMHFAMASGRPERYLRKEKVQHVHKLAASGRLDEAAKMVDLLYQEIGTAGEREPAPPGPPLDGPFGERPIVGPGHDVPLMLSAPPAPRPIERSEIPAASPLPELARAVLRAEPPAPAEKPSPRPLILIAAGLILFPAALIAAAAWKFRRKTEAAEAKQSLTDKYAIGSLITSGGMGEVYEGQDLTLGRKVALKRMLPDLKLDASLRQQFLQEARTVAKLTHPYIVQIHDCMESGEDVYLVFEFVKGKTLAQILTERPRLPLKECLRIFSHVCQAVDHAHKNHILHRDLKPANIMIDENGIARVMDFGIALESTRTMASAGPGFLDASGTLRYMPPEQHYGKSVRASDVYAMGVCLYEMTTGTLPFAAGSVDELIEQKRGRRFPAPSALVPGLPKEFDLFVTAVLAPDPQDRMGSALEFLELLEGVAAA